MKARSGRPILGIRRGEYLCQAWETTRTAASGRRNDSFRRGSRIRHLTGAEARLMTQEAKRAKVERDEPSEDESKKDITNDSLGTVDPADSTGLDSDEQTGNDRPRKEKSE